MDLELGGRCALVTGASEGIGRAIAQALAVEGVRVALVARNLERLHDTASAITARGGASAVIIAQDLTALGALDRIVSRAIETLHAIDIIVHSAGGSRPLAVDASDEEWGEAFAINFDVIRRLTQIVLPSMRARRWGRVISITGSSEPKSLNAANAAKAAVHAWSKGLSLEVARDGVTVNAIAPGRIMSQQIRDRLYPTEEARRRFAEAHIPMGRFGDPNDAADLAVFLASNRAMYITGEIVHVDGGLRRFAF